LAAVPSPLSPNLLAHIRHARARDQSRIALESEEASRELNGRRAE
jgi:hypothetical protein